MRYDRRNRSYGLLTERVVSPKGEIGASECALVFKPHKERLVVAVAGMMNVNKQD